MERSRLSTLRVASKGVLPSRKERKGEGDNLSPTLTKGERRKERLYFTGVLRSERRAFPLLKKRAPFHFPRGKGKRGSFSSQ